MIGLRITGTGASPYADALMLSLWVAYPDRTDEDTELLHAWLHTWANLCAMVGYFRGVA